MLLGLSNASDRIISQAFSHLFFQHFHTPPESKLLSEDIPKAYTIHAKTLQGKNYARSEQGFTFLPGTQYLAWFGIGAKAN